MLVMFRGWFTVAGRLYGKVIGNGRVRAMVEVDGNVEILGLVDGAVEGYVDGYVDGLC